MNQSKQWGQEGRERRPAPACHKDAKALRDHEAEGAVDAGGAPALFGRPADLWTPVAEDRGVHRQADPARRARRGLAQSIMCRTWQTKINLQQLFVDANPYFNVT